MAGTLLSIGLTTRFGELANAGRKPLLAFSAGVLVNEAAAAAVAH